MSFRCKTRSLLADALYRGIKRGVQKSSGRRKDDHDATLIADVELEVWSELDGVFDITDSEDDSRRE